MLDVIFYEVFEEEQEALERFLPKDVRAGFTPLTIQEKAEENPIAPVISIRTQSVIPPGWSGRLKGVLARSQGHDHLVKYKQETGSSAALGFIGDYCSRAVAEHAVLAMMCLLRKIKMQIRQFDNFSRDKLTGREAGGKNALVVGVGAIGAEIVDLCRGLRQNVKGVDLEHRMADLEYAGLDESVPWADVIFCALPLTPQTQGMLNYGVLKHVPKKALLINVSRGEITPTEDLKRLLDEGVLGGLALDVFDREQELAHCLRAGEAGDDNAVDTALQLKDRDNVLFTPHNAFNTSEALEEKARLSAESVCALINNSPLPFPVPPAE